MVHITFRSKSPPPPNTPDGARIAGYQWVFLSRALPDHNSIIPTSIDKYMEHKDEWLAGQKEAAIYFNANPIKALNDFQAGIYNLNGGNRVRKSSRRKSRKSRKTKRRKSYRR